MNKKRLYFPLCIILFSCKSQQSIDSIVQVAFMADVHFADVFPDFDYSSDKPWPDSTEVSKPLIRTMESQLRSTRLFNENYLAFRAALDDAVSKGIKIIALPRDFSDDGQPIHIKGLHRILEYYEKKHGITFLLASGNHDPTTPFGSDGGKLDFLGANGKAQPIMSIQRMYDFDLELENTTLITELIKEWGYADITSELKEYGFFPRSEYLYWETPFSKYSYNEYTLENAKEASFLDNRMYTSRGETIKVPDVSYLVEPVAGLWLLSIDANVFLPADDGSFYGNGIGYNQVIEHKAYLVAWTKKVAAKAKRKGLDCF